MRESWAAMLACSLQPCVLGSQLRGRMSASSQATTGIWLLQGSLGQPFCRGENARGGRHFSENSLVTSVYLSSTGLAGCRLPRDGACALGWLDPTLDTGANIHPFSDAGANIRAR